MIKLLVSDLDGTFLSHERNEKGSFVSDANMEAMPDGLLCKKGRNSFRYSQSKWNEPCKISLP